jgi:hypothetical protein
MRFLAIFFLAILSCLSAEALKKRQLEQTFAGILSVILFISSKTNTIEEKGREERKE